MFGETNLNVLYVLALLCMLNQAPAKADVVMNLTQDGTVFYSRKHTAKAILANDGTEYHVSSQHHAPYKIQVTSAKLKANKPLDLWLACGRAYLSDDGSILVWLLLGGFTGHLKLECVDAKARGFEYISPPNKFNRMLRQPALAVFKNGKLIKTYALEALLVRPILVKETAEQTVWIRPFDFEDEKHFPALTDPALSSDGKVFSFETSSFRKYKIDTQNGNFIQASDTDFWKESNAIVWGKFTKSEQKNKLMIESITPLKGKGVPRRITVHDRTGSYYGFDYHLPFWTGAALQKHGKRYEIVKPLWNFPMHVEPW